MNRHMIVSLALFLGILLVTPVIAADFVFHGDLNNRFGLYTNQQGFFASDQKGTIDDGDRPDSFASLKYRLWTEATSNDGAVKGVFAVEVGAVRFGRNGGGKGEGGGFSGDAVNIETRWAYTDIQIPNVSSKARVKIGLFPFKVNSFLWDETATGVQFSSDRYTLAWVRGKEALTGSTGGVGDEWGDNDLDALLGRYDFTRGSFKAGTFVLVQWQNTSDTTAFALDSQNYQIKKLGNVDFSLTTLGTDGSWSIPLSDKTLFVNWDLLYQTGSFDNLAFTDSLSGTTNSARDYDLSAYFIHADTGLKFGKSTLTYTGWYASGDNDPNDDEFNAFITTDLDRSDSIVLMEGGYTDDVYFTERPELFDKGFIMNKIALDHQTTQKLKTGAALLYMLTAEDIEYTDALGRHQQSDEIGVELDAYASYQLYPNVTLAINAGYLFAGDALDRFEVGSANVVDGNADNDIFRSTASVRYKF
jgi:hypothetical protein